MISGDVCKVKSTLVIIKVMFPSKDSLQTDFSIGMYRIYTPLLLLSEVVGGRIPEHYPE